ncbi:MAG TPA: hypothetical protein VII49_00090 [Rhizomicrobium sp.]
MFVRCRAVLVGMTAMLVGGFGVFLAFGMPAVVVMMGRLAMMMRGSFMVRRCRMMMFTG